MSLDAIVWCDCYEKGKLREPPPPGISLVVEPDGALGYEESPAADFNAWCEWRQHACEHPVGTLLHRRLGNIGEIGLLRSELQREAGRFPLLLSKVLYSGSHSGDHLPFE